MTQCGKQGSLAVAVAPAAGFGTTVSGGDTRYGRHCAARAVWPQELIAFLRKSVRSTLLQSGTALILFSFTRTSACAFM